MLVRFSVENHLSYRDRAEVSLVAGPYKDPQADLIRVGEIGGELLPAAAIYGANASGKSNILTGLSFLKTAVMLSHKKGTPGSPIPVRPFVLDAESQQNPSKFFIEFIVSDCRYTYSVELNASRVFHEALHAYPLGRPQVWFVRNGQDFQFGKNLKGANKATASLTRENSLFVSAAATNNHEQLGAIYQFFAKLNVGAEDDFLGTQFARWYKNHQAPQRVLDVLRNADIGVCGIDIETDPTPPDAKKFMTELQALIQANMADGPEVEFPQLMQRIRLSHASSSGSVPIAFDMESAGTKAFIGILPEVMDSLDTGGILVLDELVETLHPVLSQRIVEMFQHRETNPRGAQLIFSTHDTNVLSVLRRDQVWFVAKDHSGESRIYPLSDFRTRKGDDISRDYLRGRFGALPYIDHLLSTWNLGDANDGAQKQ